jgi:RND family efflux transporter MFP subunit
VVVAAAMIAVRKEPPRRKLATLPPLVESMVVRAEDVQEQFVGYGTVRAIRDVRVAAEVAANVVERVGDIRAGSVVTRGQVLVLLDDRQYRHVHDRAVALADAEQASLSELEGEAKNLKELVETAEQELRVARSEKLRVTDLFEHNMAAKKEYDFANLAYQQARRVLQGYERELARVGPRSARFEASKRGYEADAALAWLNIERCRIKAPFAGRIDTLSVDAGDRVGPGSVVLRLIDSSRVEIPIRLPAAVYDRVRVGAPCRVGYESRAGVAWSPPYLPPLKGGLWGVVTRIAPTADERTRTFAVYIVVDNIEGESGELVPGMFVRGQVDGPLHHGAILVPRGACRAGRVFIVEDDLARIRSVTIERFIEERAMVSGDLQSGDRVILSHLGKLADGSPVRLSPERSAASTAQPPTASRRLGGSP